MTLKKSLLEFLKKKQPPIENETPEGICPNCWGRQEYGGKFYEAVKNYNADVNEKNPNIGWVEDYANKHIKGIMLHEENEKLVCPKCKISYRTD